MWGTACEQMQSGNFTEQTMQRTSNIKIGQHYLRKLFIPEPWSPSLVKKWRTSLLTSHLSAFYFCCLYAYWSYVRKFSIADARNDDGKKHPHRISWNIAVSVGWFSKSAYRFCVTDIMRCVVLEITSLVRLFSMRVSVYPFYCQHFTVSM